MVKQDDKFLVNAYLKGDNVAVSKVDTFIASAFSAWAHKFGWQKDDIISDASFKLLMDLRRGRFKFESSLKTYIGAIVSHTCIDYIRAAKRFDDKAQDIPTPAFALNAEQGMEKRQMAFLTFRVLRRASKECRQLWQLYLKHRLTCGQIGKIMEKTEGNIRRRLWACRQTAINNRQLLLQESKQF